MRRTLSLVFLFLVFNVTLWCQTLKQRPSAPTQTAETSPPNSPAQSIPLTVPPDTPLKVALDREVHIQKAGQLVYAKTVEPIYVFDKLVIPAGSDVIGKVTNIEQVPKRKRAMAAMNADFSPPHQVQIEFNELVLADGRHLPLQTTVFPGSAGVLQFVPAREKGKTNKVKGAASTKVGQARQQAKQELQNIKKQIQAPGKVHRLERYAVAQLPYHPQYISSGTSFNADLRQPLSFGTEDLHPEALTAIGTHPPAGSVVHAQLVTPLSSRTNKKGDRVDAVISQPLFASDHLIFPQGSHLEGTVLQVRSARRLNRNGQLRIVFRRVVPPNGTAEKVEASLEGVAVAKGEHLSLDSEGGAQVTTPKTRYLTTGIAVALASSSAFPDHDRGLRHAGDGGGEGGGGAANGASGFRLVGALTAALARSRAVTSAFGVYGASMSVYSHFLARGHDVVYPKDMSMLIGIGGRDTASAASVPEASVRRNRRAIGPL